MRFMDPLPVECERCSSVSEHRVRDLLGMVATCGACGNKLDTVGLRMQAGLDEWNRFVTLAELAVGIEEQLGQAIIDAELEGVETLRDVAVVVRRHLDDDREAASRSVAVVRAAARNVAGGEIEEGAFDLPLLAALSRAQKNE